MLSAADVSETRLYLCEKKGDKNIISILDKGSSNGTFVDGIRI